MSRRLPRRLRLCESLPLGERRFVAVIEFEESRFLVGGTSSSLVLLANLGRHGDSASEVGTSLAGTEASGARQAERRAERQAERQNGKWGGD
jgi:flagellar biogenesis protein FliO